VRFDYLKFDNAAAAAAAAAALVPPIPLAFAPSCRPPGLVAASVNRYLDRSVDNQSWIILSAAADCNVVYGAI